MFSRLYKRIAAIPISKVYHYVLQLLARGMAALRALLSRIGVSSEGMGDEDLDKALKIAGYTYDPKQDIFYSNMDPWQRMLGYCRLYDEAAAPMGMIIDCEPIYFEYEGKSWMIELWKGQYDMATGGEIGVYTTERTGLDIPGIGVFYNCADNTDRLKLSYTFKKNGETLFIREDIHWWLTGFKLGEFSEPSELTMDISITLKDDMMCSLFLEGLKNTWYPENDISVNGYTVSFKFGEPFTEQPKTRIPETDSLIQRKNKLLCDKYQEITKPYDRFPDKIKAVQAQAPELIEEILNIRKSKQLLAMYEIIKEYLNYEN